MLTYEYMCSACAHKWEEEQRIVDPPVTTCPACHGQTAHRLVSAGNFILKGGGWYADLYAKPSKPGSGSPKTSAASKAGDQSSETSTASKPDQSEKPDAKPACSSDPASSAHVPTH